MYLIKDILEFPLLPSSFPIQMIPFHLVDPFLVPLLEEENLLKIVVDLLLLLQTASLVLPVTVIHPIAIQAVIMEVLLVQAVFIILKVLLMEVLHLVDKLQINHPALG